MTIRFRLADYTGTDIEFAEDSIISLTFKIGVIEPIIPA
jgi:hypothetical protein